MHKVVTREVCGSLKVSVFRKGLCWFSCHRRRESATTKRGNWGCGSVRSVRGGYSTCSLSLVSRGDGGVLIRIASPRPPPVLLLLPLHAPVLKPDLDVALGEAQGQRQLDAPRPGDVAVEQKLLLELQQLCARVRSPGALVLLGFRHHVWPLNHNNRLIKTTANVSKLFGTHM